MFLFSEMPENKTRPACVCQSKYRHQTGNARIISISGLTPVIAFFIGGEISRGLTMVSGRGAKAKGDNFEREVAAYLNLRVDGLDAYRTPLSGMRGGRETATPDISNTPGVAIECKRTETISARKWMKQAVEAAGDDAPVVITRQNRDAMDDALVIMRLGDWVRFYEAAR